MDIKQYENPGMSGVIEGEPNEVYHATGGAVSCSRLKEFGGRPRKYHAIHVAKTMEREVKEAWRLGTQLHTILLEPEAYLKRYAVLPDVPSDYTGKRNKDGSPTKTSKEYKVWEENVLNVFRRTHDGKEFSSTEDDKTVRAMRDNALQVPCVAATLPLCKRELTMRSDVLPLGFRVQCKFDAITPVMVDGKYRVIDVKKICNLSQALSQIAQFKYYWQTGFYYQVALLAAGIEIEDVDWLFLFVEEAPPHETMVVRLTHRAIAQGMAEVQRDLQYLGGCYKHNVWPSYTDMLQKRGDIYLPRMQMAGVEDGIVIADIPDWYTIKYAETL